MEPGPLRTCRGRILGCRADKGGEAGVFKASSLSERGPSDGIPGASNMASDVHIGCDVDPRKTRKKNTPSLSRVLNN